MWFDEYASWWAASMPLSGLWQLLANVDLAIAPYYLLLRGWIWLFGDTPALLRLPSALAMSAAAILISALGKRLFGARNGLIAGLLFAATPAIARYGQEARVYAFVVALALLATLLLLRALEDRARTRRWLAYSASLVALGLAHAPALCLMSAHASALIAELSVKPWRLRLRGVWAWSISTAAALLALAPMLWLASAQTAQIAWNVTDYGDLVRYPSQLFWARPLALALMALALFALLKPAQPRLLLACWAIVPPAFYFVTRDALHLFLPRYLLFTLPAWVLLAAAGMEDIARRTRQAPTWLALGTVVLLGLALNGSARSRRPSGGFDHRAAGAFIKAAQQEGDAIAFGGGFKPVRHARIALRYELREHPPRDIFAAIPMLENADFAAEECAAGAACLPADVTRLWLVTLAGSEDPWAGMPKERRETLQSAFEVVARREQNQANVFLLARKR
jgi:mannosyltransferase